MRGRVVLILLGLAFLCGHVQAQETAQEQPVQEQPVMQAQEKEPTKGLRFFYRVGRWTDDYLRKGIDTTYIDLPEHSWRFAGTMASMGVNSRIASEHGGEQLSLLNRAMPSVDLGLYAGYRAIGFGYSWDVLHASAAMMLVCYSVNHISYFVPDSLTRELPSGEPMYVLHPAIPVHVTGNVRAAVSWEINRWIHLSAVATGDHLRFRSGVTANGNTLLLSAWSWKAQLAFGVRVGAGQDRLERALGKSIEPSALPADLRKNKLPRWLTDFFWSPK